ncbi:G/U mismatch-specific DNA glycosylase, partial [Lachnellula occidentalis]
KRPKPTSYAHPSTYSHLPPLPDILAPSLHLLFIGLNPGLTTASQGHAYAHPSNRFWALLHSSGITTRRLRPDEDATLLEWGCGNTNIVARPTRNGGELSRGEMDGSVGVLVGKVVKWRPEAVCVVGKSIWESIFRVLKRRSLKKDEFAYGWQEGARLGAEEDGIDVENGETIKGWEGARVFVACSTSGLAASVPFAEKERIWRELGVWIEGRRIERSGIAEPPLKSEDP